MSADAIFQAVLDEPDEDAPRLILADWLEEHGDRHGRARAELIRVQCELARWVPDLTRREALLARERDLIAAHLDDWLGELAQRCVSCPLSRGLVQLTLYADRFLDAPAERLAGWLRGALVESVRLLHLGDGASRLARCCALEAVGALVLDGPAKDYE